MAVPRPDIRRAFAQKFYPAILAAFMNTMPAGHMSRDDTTRAADIITDAMQGEAQKIADILTEDAQEAVAEDLQDDIDDVIRNFGIANINALDQLNEYPADADEEAKEIDDTTGEEKKESEEHGTKGVGGRTAEKETQKKGIRTVQTGGRTPTDEERPAEPDNAPILQETPGETQAGREAAPESVTPAEEAEKTPEEAPPGETPEITNEQEPSEDAPEAAETTGIEPPESREKEDLMEEELPQEGHEAYRPFTESEPAEEQSIPNDTKKNIYEETADQQESAGGHPEQTQKSSGAEIARADAAQPDIPNRSTTAQGINALRYSKQMDDINGEQRELEKSMRDPQKKMNHARKKMIPMLALERATKLSRLLVRIFAWIMHAIGLMLDITVILAAIGAIFSSIGVGASAYAKTLKAALVAVSAAMRPHKDTIQAQSEIIKNIQKRIQNLDTQRRTLLNKSLLDQRKRAQ